MVVSDLTTEEHALGSHHRRSIRLRDYDYSRKGAYFVTICTHGKSCLFGDIRDRGMHLNETGKIIKKFWEAIPYHFKTVQLDISSVMPNHIHGILWITERAYSLVDRNVGARHASPLQNRETPVRPRGSQQNSIGTIIGSFKSATARFIHASFTSAPFQIWQRNYFERIIRNERELYLIRKYILNNPRKWELDRENPEAREVDDVNPWEI